MHRNRFWLEKSLSCRWLKAVFVCACSVFKLFPGTCFCLLLETEYCAGWTCGLTHYDCLFNLMLLWQQFFFFFLFVIVGGSMLLPTRSLPSFNLEQMEQKMGYRFLPQPSKICQAYCKNICLAVNLRHHSLHLPCAEPPVTITDIYQRTANTCHPSKLYLWKIYMHKRACWLS